MTAPSEPGIRLTQLFVYPLKSGRGIRLDEAAVDTTGLLHDRRFMVVDEEGVFLTQRQDPRLTLIVPAMEGDRLRLAAPGMEDLVLPLEPEGHADVRTRVWEDVVDALAVGAHADDWMSTFLGSPRRLVHFPRDGVRPVDPEYARKGDRVAFADGYPFLLANEASLEDLNRRMDARLEMERFRPNLVVAGAGAFAEDGWREIRIGEVPFRVVKACARCAITTVDPATAAVGHEPLRTLAGYRRRNGKVMFGQNAVHDGSGMLRTGDAVRVLGLG